jgi:adenylate cyclase
VEKKNITPHLLLYNKSKKGKRYFLLESTDPQGIKTYWTVGRGQENDLVLNDQWISRNHAILQTTDTGDFYLIDLGSRNGTFVNGRRVSIPVTLKDADQVTFGKTEVEFHCPSHLHQSDDVVNPIDMATMTSTLHERQLTSVMVVDMRNFTVLTRQLDDKILSQLIGNWFREAGNIIRDAGSWVDKYIGDAVMAIWFHGTENVNPPEILQIFQAVNKINKMTQKLSQQYPLPFELRIGSGINTGYAMVGNTGSGYHPDYTAIGDTVNAAFRLESATKQLALDIAIGEATFKYLAQLHPVKQLFKQNTVNLKGYENPTVTYGINFQDLDQFLSGL